MNSRAYEKPDAFMAYEGSVAYKVWGEVKKAPAQFTFIIKSAPEVPCTSLSFDTVFNGGSVCLYSLPL